jgi:hypothetical protein
MLNPCFSARALAYKRLALMISHQRLGCKTFIAFGAVLIAAITQAKANDFQFMGPGNVACTEYTRLSRTPAHNDFTSWMTDFISGWNAASLANSKTYRNLGAYSLESMEQWMLTYCTQHPTKVYLDGVIELTIKLLPMVYYGNGEENKIPAEDPGSQRRDSNASPWPSGRIRGGDQ